MTRTVANSLFRSSSSPSTSSSTSNSLEDSQNVLLKECSSSSVHIEAFSNLASSHRTFFPYHRTFSKRTNNIPKELNYNSWKISLQTPILLPNKNNENSSESVKNVYNENEFFDKDGKFEYGNKKAYIQSEQEKFPFGRDSTNKGNYKNQSQNNSTGDLENLNNNNNNNNSINNNSNSNNIGNRNSNNLDTKKNQEIINEGNKILERYNSVESLLLSPDSEEKNFDFISYSTSNEKKRSSDTKKMTILRNSSDFGINDSFFPSGISTERSRISKENERLERNENENSGRIGMGKGRNEMLIARRSSIGSFNSFNSFDQDSDDENDKFHSKKNDNKNRNSNKIESNKSVSHDNNNYDESVSILKKFSYNDTNTTTMKNTFGKK
jgi:hypothetical protein